MITSVTLNPSVDRRYMLEKFEGGKIFRTSRFEATAGGKGLNVARVASSLGEKVFATGLLGGKSGEFIEQQLKDSSIPHHFVKIKGETRSCIAILSDSGEQTEILESGPTVTKEEITLFSDHYEALLNKSSIIVASGSILSGMPVTIYADMIHKAKEKHVPFLLDTSGVPLLEGIKASPTLIKPNLEELETIMNQSLSTEREIIQAGKILSQSGIEYVIVSLGGDGSIFIHQENVFRVRLPKVAVQNPVGSGDAMVAGFAIGLSKQKDLIQTIKFASACGTANAMEEGTGFLSKKLVGSLMNEIHIEQI
ncbi:1-phosphofructokinase [Fictibacillus sp. B-59209]|uniref:1-phosphofructokinase n=1 Tax=Fictibacillus sp. B-59209 TaxID=3024873 RepID=UPI002E207400|nr:1-phosphofructokinase [Fictibacillus sp. B-59209]